MLPRKIKYTVVADIIEFLVSTTSILDGDDAPPRQINYAGAGDFHGIGDNSVRLLCEKAALAPGQRVLEIGCGIGRNALALHRLHGEAIDYSGFDVVRYGITWCNKHFERKNSQYQFEHADIYNSFYNPRGATQPHEYAFGYPDASFDLVFATSVFTHMQPKEFYHFLDESLRVLRPGGKLYCTAFIWDTESEACCKKGVADFSFRFSRGSARIEIEREPDVAVAHDKDALLVHLSELDLDEVGFFAGTWRGTVGLDFQDVLVIRKAG